VSDLECFGSFHGVLVLDGGVLPTEYLCWGRVVWSMTFSGGVLTRVHS
jgi:hypothetical protein